MCGPLAIPLAIVGSAALGAGASVISANKAASAQKKASKQAEKQAIATQAANTRAFNQENQKSPDLMALFRQNMMSASGGVGSTMLTGPGGVDLSNSLLGRATLLGN